MAWQTAGILTNPAGGTVLADSGALPAAQRAVTFVVATTVLAVVICEWRDSTNTTTLKSQAFMVNTSESLIFNLPWAVLNMQANERLRITLNATIVGSIQASTFVD